jgi:FKBP-type peptidyl-prolyl cis-trans isomerase FklB
MPTLFTRALSLIASGAMLLGIASAQNQQTPASTNPPANTQSSTGKMQAPTAKKPTAAKSATPFTLKTDKDKFSYALGMTMGTTLHRDAVDVDPAIVARGMKDAMAGGKTLMTQDEARNSITGAQNQARAREEAKSKKEGEEFLAANKAKEGVVTLPSGLQYKIESAGNGPKPAASDTVVCNYRGMLVDGTEFDNSYKRGQPATFPVSRVIRGWTEALQLMPVGSKWRLFIPSDLAYGERGEPRAGIGPNSTLIFEVELLSIQGNDAKPEAKEPDQK